jgi:hypothetical protein
MRNGWLIINDVVIWRREEGSVVSVKIFFWHMNGETLEGHKVSHSR